MGTDRRTLKIAVIVLDVGRKCEYLRIPKFASSPISDGESRAIPRWCSVPPCDTRCVTVTAYTGPVLRGSSKRVARRDAIRQQTGKCRQKFGVRMDPRESYTSIYIYIHRCTRARVGYANKVVYAATDKMMSRSKVGRVFRRGVYIYIYS